MKRYRKYRVVLFAGFCNLALAQIPQTGINVCIKGNGKVFPGQEMRTFSVNIRGVTGALNGTFELQTAKEAQGLHFAMEGPAEIEVADLNNRSFRCKAPLDIMTRWVEVIIEYPQEYLPYCLIASSPSPHPCTF